MEKLKFRDLYIEASANYLTEPFPEDFKVDDVETFIDQHRWEPMEDWPIADIDDAIFDCARGFAQLLEKRGISVWGYEK